ncbi:MAG: hypothetical protein PIR02_09785 [Microbacterium enclense]
MTDSEIIAPATPTRRRRRRMIGSTVASTVLVGALMTAGAIPAQAACEESGQWLFSPSSQSGESLVSVGPPQSNYNGTGATSTSVFTAEVSGTVEATVSGSANVGVDAKLANISATYGTSVSASLTASLGNQTSIEVPPGQTGNGQYGIYTVTVTGTETLYGPSCEVVESRSTTITSPTRVGWNTWWS